MSKSWLVAVVATCAMGSVGCGGDDDGDKGSGGSGGNAGSGTSGSATSGSGSGGNAGSGPSGASQRCQDGCVAVIEAMCSIAPDSQESCESDCTEFETGACASEYEAFQDCAEGEPITCNGLGIPAVAGCESQQSAFIACM